MIMQATRCSVHQISIHIARSPEKRVASQTAAALMSSYASMAPELRYCLPKSVKRLSVASVIPERRIQRRKISQVVAFQPVLAFWVHPHSRSLECLNTAIQRKPFGAHVKITPVFVRSHNWVPAVWI